MYCDYGVIKDDNNRLERCGRVKRRWYKKKLLSSPEIINNVLFYFNTRLIVYFSSTVWLYHKMFYNTVGNLLTAFGNIY